MGPCGGHKYATSAELERWNRLKLATDPKSKDEYDILTKELESRLCNPKKGGCYRFIGYQKFTNRTIGARRKDNKGNPLPKMVNPDGTKTRPRKPRTGDVIDTLDNCVLIVDEAHQLNKNDWGEAVRIMIKRSKNIRVIFMSATPMTNYPNEIIRLLNPLLPDERKLKRKEVFIDEYTLTDEGLDLIAEASRGVVSYSRGVHPLTFPQRIEVGEIIKPIDIPEDENFKYTKLIRCEMSKFHLDTYDYYNKDSETLPKEIRQIVDMVLPNPHDENIGIFRDADLHDYLSVDPQFLKKHQIEVLRTKDKIVVSGDILLKKNIGKYSTKYFKLIENIEKSLNPDSGPIFLYNENIKGIGLSLFEEILKRNGIGKYGEVSNNYTGLKCVRCGEIYEKHKSNHDYIPTLFMILEGDTDKHIRSQLINQVNSPENKDGSIIKIILGSGVTKESIDFKNIREIHIFNFEWNLSTIEQIIGRGVRHCSHYLLEKDRQNVKIYKYVSSLPSDSKGRYRISAEERIYLKAERTHVTIKRIERVLKVNSIDCALNKYDNVFGSEIIEYKNCNKKGHQNCSALCDYMDCNYTCRYEPKVKMVKDGMPIFETLELKDLDTDTYDINFSHREIARIKKEIIKLYMSDVIWTLESIVNHLQNNKSIPYMEEKYVHIALDELVTSKDVVFNRFNEEGYILFVGNYYIYQPIERDTDISLDERRIPNSVSKVQVIRLSDYIRETPRYQKTRRFKKTEFVSAIVNESQFSKVEKTIDRLDFAEQVIILEDVILAVHKGESKLTNYNSKILKHFESVLVSENQLRSAKYNIDMYNTDISTDPNVTIIGHFLNPEPKCIVDNEWQYCKLKINKLQVRQFKENNFIVGYMSKNKVGKVSFKIREVSSDEVKDRRKRKRGFVCMEMSDKKKLQGIAKRLGVSTAMKTKKGSITELCKLIELNLRERQQKAIEDGTNERWFYNHWEL